MTTSTTLPYVPLEPFPNDAPATGGDSTTVDFNVYYKSGDIAWVMISTALVLLMIPGVGFFYSGLARRKSALSLLWLSVMAAAVVSFQWFFWGYSLAFSHNAGRFIGNLDNFGFKDVLGAPSVGSSSVPDLLFAVYQGMFAAITASLAVGAVAERGRMLPCVIYIFIWTTVIYDPIACWTWNPSGWVYQLGGLDFAGGTPVHVVSGSSALAYSYMLGKRRGHGTAELNYRPHNVTHIVIGTVFLWVGWFGFNAGSALAANLQGVLAMVVTNLSACVGGITWCLVDYRLENKWSTVGFCSGIIAGLVVVTPASGFIPVWAAVIFGIIGGSVCNYATKLKYFLRSDDALDIFAVHGVGGIFGNLLTGIFAADYIASLNGSGAGSDGETVPLGWINGHWSQLGYQLADTFAGGLYSFAGTCLILGLIDFTGRWIPLLRLRVTEEEEVLGIDDIEIGEFAYDFVEANREALNYNGINEDAISTRSMSHDILVHPHRNSEKLRTGGPV